MTNEQIQVALREIAAEKDPTIKNLRLASLTTAVFRDAGFELVLVGGSAIEAYTEGAYTSGDVDLCIASSREQLTVRLRQTLMARLNAEGGPRSWRVQGGFVDILGSFENLANTPIRRIEGPYGPISVAPVEELLVERVLVATYPQSYPPAKACAEKLVAAALRGEIELDWAEAQRLAESPEYRNFNEVRALVDETAKTIQERSPYDSHA